MRQQPALVSKAGHCFVLTVLHACRAVEDEQDGEENVLLHMPSHVLPGLVVWAEEQSAASYLVQAETSSCDTAPSGTASSSASSTVCEGPAELQLSESESSSPAFASVS